MGKRRRERKGTVDLFSDTIIIIIIDRRRIRREKFELAFFVLEVENSDRRRERRRSERSSVEENVDLNRGNIESREFAKRSHFFCTVFARLSFPVESAARRISFLSYLSNLFNFSLGKVN